MTSHIRTRNAEIIPYSMDTQFVQSALSGGILGVIPASHLRGRLVLASSDGKNTAFSLVDFFHDVEHVRIVPLDQRFGHFLVASGDHRLDHLDSALGSLTAPRCHPETQRPKFSNERKGVAPGKESQPCFAQGHLESGNAAMRDLVRNNHDNEDLLSGIGSLFEEMGMGDEGRQLIAETVQSVMELNWKIPSSILI